MHLLKIEAYGPPGNLDIDPAGIGKRGDMLVGGERVGRALFVDAEQITETGWRVWIAFDDDDDPAVAVIKDALRAGTSVHWHPDAEKPRLRDKIRARAARWRLSLSPA